MNSASKLKGSGDLTKEDVLRIWTMRAGNISNKDIAEEIGCNPWTSSDVIIKGQGPKVPIPPAIRQAAMATVVKKHRGNKVINSVPKSLIQQGQAESGVTDFFLACLHAEQARSRCLQAGITADTLALMQLAAQEQAGTKQAS